MQNIIISVYVAVTGYDVVLKEEAENGVLHQ